jgi:hypothetical protein
MLRTSELGAEEYDMLNFLTTWLTFQFCAISRPSADSLLTAGGAWIDRAALHALTPGFPREDWPAEPFQIRASRGPLRKSPSPVLRHKDLAHACLAKFEAG